MTVEFDSCLNLSNPQFITSTNPKAPPAPSVSTPFQPRSGSYPQVQPGPGQRAASGFRPAPPQRFVGAVVHSAPCPLLTHTFSQSVGPLHIMSNPNRVMGGHNNGRGGHPSASANQAVPNATLRGRSAFMVHGNGSGRGGYSSTSPVNGHTNSLGQEDTSPMATHYRGGFGRRGFGSLRGRGVYNLHANDVARGGLRGGVRGRARARGRSAYTYV